VIRRVYFAAALAIGVCFTLWWWPSEPKLRQRVQLEAIGPLPSAPASPPAVPAVAVQQTEELFTAGTAWPAAPFTESDYLQQLRALNKSDKSAALLLVEQGEQWYRDHGPAAEARRAMRVTLLVDLGRMPEARSFAREFIGKYPESPYRPLVQGVTGIHPRPSVGAPR
jgi:hypothetical protein